MRTKKIVISTLTIFAVAAVVVGATTAFFSDTETSTGNVLAAGSIDLGISNQSYYNGEFNQGTSWSQTLDLDDGSGPADTKYLFLDFDDLKPGDWGEDTIDLEVHDNNAWACVDVTLDSDEENVVMEPEGDLGDTGPEGELAGRINFIWWQDDGDNVYETDEDLLPAGPLGALDVGETATIALSDSSQNSVLDDKPLIGEKTYYIGKAWCFGNFNLSPVQAGQGNSPTVDPGFTCDGSGESNISQSDSLTATIAFSAIQSRNNSQFVCSDRQKTTLGLDNKDGNWAPIVDGRYGTLSFNPSHPTFDYDLDVYRMEDSTEYALIYYADLAGSWTNVNGIRIGTFTTDGSGDANVSGDIELNADLPVPADTNAPGAKFWVVPTSDLSGAQMTSWNPDDYLFEENLVTYDDTGV